MVTLSYQSHLSIIYMICKEATTPSFFHTLQKLCFDVTYLILLNVFILTKLIQQSILIKANAFKNFVPFFQQFHT